MKRKTGFTLEQHQRAGATLLRAEAEVRKVLAALYRSYIINSGEGAKVIRLLDGIGHYDLFTARDNLAALMERENPHANCSDTYFDDRPYYPPLADEDESLTFRHVPFVKRVTGRPDSRWTITALRAPSCDGYAANWPP